MIEGQDYCFINPKDEADITHIRLLTGPYKDTLFKYGKVSFKEEFDQAHLLFAYYVLESPVMKPKKLESDSDFKLHNIVEQDIIDESGTDDTETPDLLGRLSP